VSLRHMNSPSDPTSENPLASFERLVPKPESLQSATIPPGASTPARTGQGGPGGLAPEIKIGKRMSLVGGKETEIFTMTLGVETIELLPLRNWGQLDIYKWRVRGKLPGTPAGLEITFDHIKLLGETVSAKDPEGCARLEKLFSEWLAMERESLQLARKKAQAKAVPVAQETSSASEQQPLHFQAEVDNKGMVHVHCVKGKEVLASIGLNTAGFQSLVNQGFMRKPHTLRTGALHDWVELDGVLFSFEKGRNEAERLAKALNDSYLPAAGLGRGKEVVVFANAASSTGFDIQFPAKAGGLLENRRRPLTEEALDLLQDPDHCGLLHKGLVLKLTRPTLIFKQKTADGGERYLDRCAENLVTVVDDEGEQKLIDLSQPVNYLHLSAVELTAVFNHPSINRHSQAAPAANGPSGVKVQQPRPSGTSQPVSATSALETSVPAAGAKAQVSPSLVVVNAPPIAITGELPVHQSSSSSSSSSNSVERSEEEKEKEQQKTVVTPSASEVPEVEGSSAPAEPQGTAALETDSIGSPPVGEPAIIGSAIEPGEREAVTVAPVDGSGRDGMTSSEAIGQTEMSAPSVQARERLPNLWLKPVLEQQPIRFDWLACLIYEQIAAWVGNSREGALFNGKCWLVDLSESSDTDQLKAIFLAENGSFGYVSGGWMVRFENAGVAIGTPESPLQGSEVRLLGVGVDEVGRLVCVVDHGYRASFGVAESKLDAELAAVSEQGVVLMSVQEALESATPLQVMWTVAVEQSDPANPRALESTRAEGA